MSEACYALRNDTGERVKTALTFPLTALTALTFPFSSLQTHLFSSQNYEYLVTTVEPPPIQHFSSLLSNVKQIDDEKYQVFLETWKRLKILNLKELFEIYLILDVIFLNTALKYYFETMWQRTRLYPAFYLTISSYALSAAMLNSKDPKNGSKPLRLPFLDSQTHELFSQTLQGGYSCVNSKFCNWSNSNEDVEQSSYSEGQFLDTNALYPSGKFFS
jgi:hypothetical protein